MDDNIEKQADASAAIVKDKTDSELYVQTLKEEIRNLKLELALKEEEHMSFTKQATTELQFQSDEKEKKAAELVVANLELLFQNVEKENRAAELDIANKELLFQNEEKEKRAAELVIANKELVFQNEEKEKLTAKLSAANIELLNQNLEKEKRAAELVLANIELVFQNEEKEKRALELLVANKELLAFTYISSHDLQEPLRKIQTFSDLILKSEYATLSPKGKDHFMRVFNAAKRMQTLIQDLLIYSHTNVEDRKFESTDLSAIVKDVCEQLADSISEKKAIINALNLGSAYINRSQFHQLITNLISNALKFSKPDINSEINFEFKIASGLDFEKDNSDLLPGRLSPSKSYGHLKVSDNGIGFDAKYKNKIFEVFQKLHKKEQYAGTGIGLAIVKKIIDNHGGAITANSGLGCGACFDIYIPEMVVAMN